MITDAKALNSYHREGVSSLVVDKRVSVEICAMKELGRAFRPLAVDELGETDCRRPDKRVGKAFVGNSPMPRKVEDDLGSTLCGPQEAVRSRECSRSLQSLRHFLLYLVEDEHHVNGDPLNEHHTEYDTPPDVNDTLPNEELPDDNDHHDIVSFAQYGGTLEYVDCVSWFAEFSTAGSRQG